MGFPSILRIEFQDQPGKKVPEPSRASPPDRSGHGNARRLAWFGWNRVVHWNALSETLTCSCALPAGGASRSSGRSLYTGWRPARRT